MGRISLRRFCEFVLACGVYFGALPHAYFLRLRGSGADDFVAFAFEAILAWLLLAAVYVSWRQWTPQAVHGLCVTLSSVLMLRSSDVPVEMGHDHVALAILGPSCWAAALISFPVSLGLLALSAVLGHPWEPLTDRLGRALAFRRAGGGVESS